MGTKITHETFQQLNGNRNFIERKHILLFHNTWLKWGAEALRGICQPSGLQ